MGKLSRCGSVRLCFSSPSPPLIHVHVYSLLLGSTSAYCVEHAPCNVVVVKPDWSPPTHVWMIASVRLCCAEKLHEALLTCAQGIAMAQRGAKDEAEEPKPNEASALESASVAEDKLQIIAEEQVQPVEAYNS